MTLAAQCDGEQLRTWQKAVALWWVQQETKPSVTEVQTYAQGYLKTKVSKNGIERLLRNPSFLAALQQYEEEVLARPRALMETKLLPATEAHFDAIDDLRANKKWETLVKYTGPLMERIWPSRENAPMTAQIVQIVIGRPDGFAAQHVKALSPIDIAGIEEVEAVIS